MNTHVFIVDSQTFKLHLEYLFAGTGAKDKQSSFLSNPITSFNANTERNLVGMIADISRIRKGDNIIFYLQASGNTPGTFFGVFKAQSTGFFDENDEKNYLKNELGKALSFRIKISPKEVFSHGITEHEYLDSLSGKDSPHQLCWSLIYRKLKGNRGCTMIMPYEYNDLLEKLRLKNDGITLSANASFTYDTSRNAIISQDSAISFNYSGRVESTNIEQRLLFKAIRNNAFETHLQAYILQNYDIPPLNEFLIHSKESQIWVGNEVSCGVGMQRIDILIIEETNDTIHIKIVELKDEEPYDYIIDSQLPWYIKWVSEYVVPNYSSFGKKVFLHPFIIAKHTENESILNRIKNSSFIISISATICPTKLISFTIADNITFHKEI